QSEHYQLPRRLLIHMVRADPVKSLYIYALPPLPWVSSSFSIAPWREALGSSQVLQAVISSSVAPPVSRTPIRVGTFPLASFRIIILTRCLALTFARSI